MPKEKVWYEVCYLLKGESRWVPFAVPEGEDRAIECVRALMHKKCIEAIWLKVQDVPPEFTKSHA